ncbi:MAG: LPXTG cell wall anchor domain-containing protein [Clostridia bacterium]
MKKTWLTKTLVVMMTLALVAGALTITPKTTKAAATGGSISPADWTVANNVGTTQEFTVSGVTPGVAGNTLTYTWTTVSGGAAVISKGTSPHGNASCNFAVVAPGKDVVKCTVQEVDGASQPVGAAQEFTASVNVKSFVITTVPDPTTMVIGDTLTLTTDSVPAGASITWSSSDATVISVSNGTLTALKSGSNVVITAQLSDKQTDTYTITTVNKKTGVLKFTTSDITMAPGTSVDLNNYLTKTYDKPLTWSIAVNSGNATLNGASSGMLSAGSQNGTAVVSVKGDPSDVYADVGTATINIKVLGAVAITPSAASIQVLNNGVTTITASAADGSEVLGEIVNGGTGSATVQRTGPAGNTYTFTVTGGTTGNKTLRLRSVNGSNYVDIPVKIGNPTPTITAWYDPDSYTLNKSNPTWMGLHIHVENPTSNTVTIRRSNIRTFAKGYSSHPSTYEYTAVLDANNDARFYIHPQYNGVTHYKVYANGAATIQMHDITVSGYTTMPQTGPDYTWVYVLGGLCVAALAAAVTLNVRKKKQAN